MDSMASSSTTTSHPIDVSVTPIKTSARTVGRKATITKEELFQATLNLIGPQKVLHLSAYAKLRVKQELHPIVSIDTLKILMNWPLNLLIVQVLYYDRLFVKPDYKLLSKTVLSARLSKFFYSNSIQMKAI